MTTSSDSCCSFIFPPLSKEEEINEINTKIAQQLNTDSEIIAKMQTDENLDKSIGGKEEKCEENKVKNEDKEMVFLKENFLLFDNNNLVNNNKY
jgi:hypothetical protein